MNIRKVKKIMKYLKKFFLSLKNRILFFIFFDVYSYYIFLNFEITIWLLKLMPIKLTKFLDLKNLQNYYNHLKV